jgi:multiple sugar transport system permease protein
MSSVVPSADNRRADSVRRPLLSRQLRRDLRAYLFLSPWLIGLLVFTAYPVLASFYFSMTKYNILTPPRWVGTDNFVKLFADDPLFWKAVGNTTYYTLISVPLGLLVALALALLLNQRRGGIGLYRTAFYLPSLVPTVVITMIWSVMLDPRLGLVNSALGAIGLPGPGWLRSAAWSKPALILMSLWSGSGSAMLIFLAGLKDVPASLLDAAMIDGANRWQRLRHVVLPLLTPTIFFNLVIGIINSFQVFVIAFIATSASGIAGSGTGGAGPLNSLLMYMVLLYRNAFRYFDLGYASAMALVMFIVLVSLTLIVVRSSDYWVHYESAPRR